MSYTLKYRLRLFVPFSLHKSLYDHQSDTWIWYFTAKFPLLISALTPLSATFCPLLVRSIYITTLRHFVPFSALPQNYISENAYEEHSATFCPLLGVGFYTSVYLIDPV